MEVIFLILLSVFGNAVHAAYPSAKPNHNLEEEVLNQKDRLIPQFEKFNFAVDGDVWERALGQREYYHGVGYWVQARTEIRPNPYFFINTRSIFFSGSSSEGYAFSKGFYSLVGFSGVWPGAVLDSRLQVRVVDLERQSVAQGLLIQDREMNGILALLSNDYYSFKLMVDSTGAHYMSDDTYNLELRFLDRWIGVGSVFFVTQESGPNYKGSNSLTDRAPYHYITSMGNLSKNWGVGLEAGMRNQYSAGMMNVSYSPQWGKFKIKSKAEYRAYENGFAQNEVGFIQHQYTSYDQLDKSFTSPMNIFVYDDDVQVYALHLDMEWSLNDKWKLESLNEAGNFDFNRRDEKAYYYYRAGIAHCPIVDRQDCISIFGSNKVLNDSYSIPPAGRSFGNFPFFKQAAYAGIDAQFKF